MDAWQVWALGAVGVIGLLGTIFLIWLGRARSNERLIGKAIVAMNAAMTEDPPPHRSLLSKVIDVLSVQDHATGRIRLKLLDLIDDADESPLEPEALIDELLNVPGPQLLITEFFELYAGSQDPGAALTSMAARVVRTAIWQVFGDLATDRPAALERLLLLADGGRIAPVALEYARSRPRPATDGTNTPTANQLDPPTINRIADALQSTTSRQLRLATLLHGQGEAILR
jgi:hypothetical protein